MANSGVVFSFFFIYPREVTKEDILVLYHQIL